VLGNKYFLFGLTWLAAFGTSAFFRFWGLQHPDSFVIRPFIVLVMLFGPSLALSFYLAFIARQTQI